MIPTEPIRLKKSTLVERPMADAQTPVADRRPAVADPTAVIERGPLLSPLSSPTHDLGVGASVGSGAGVEGRSGGGRNDRSRGFGRAYAILAVLATCLFVVGLAYVSYDNREPVSTVGLPDEATSLLAGSSKQAPSPSPSSPDEQLAVEVPIGSSDADQPVSPQAFAVDGDVASAESTSSSADAATTVPSDSAAGETPTTTADRNRSTTGVTSTTGQTPSSRQTPVTRQPTVTRQSTVTRPSTTSGNGRSTRPSSAPTTVRPDGPVTRPTVASTRPVAPTTRPTRTSTRPTVPTTRPTAPTTRPPAPTTRPTTPTTRATTTTTRPTTTTLLTTTTTRATMTTTTPAPPGGSGRVVWEDDFSSLDTSTWRLEHSTYGDGNNELQCYRPENVSVSGGKLVLKAVTESYTCPNGSTRRVTSGMVRSRGVTFSPGQAIEFRVKLNPADRNDQGGLWPAVWASGWAGGGWPRAGEMDWLEVMTAENARRAMFSIHYADSSGRHKLQNKGVIGSDYFSDSWHTVRFDYGTGGRLTWYLDGQVAFQVEGASTLQGYPAPFDETVGEIKINLALGGRPGPLADGAVGSRGASFEVDYIRILQL